ncbi:autotransporter domain-containing protein [Lysobacter arenosi]|uniref:Autotransporter domain-containing protein n=1 Tax=Lysobacter arenosi TaxID=2795387 RepID=A0ABX7RBL1_9GAMM|nr:autotransporter domain-containing protein [Lysobacter arenosi]QSX75115.1 autotransporter domain-containing protein [Lysobacter arenosi]
MPTRLDAPPAVGDEHLRVMHAVDAHLNGHKGNGQFIALFDTGALRTPALDQHLWWSNDSDLVDRDHADYTRDDVNGHGTATALAAIGRAQGSWSGGIAPDANLSVMRIIPDQPTLGNPFGQPTVEAGLTALERGLSGKSAFTRAAGFTWDGNFQWTDPAISTRLFNAFATFVDSSTNFPPDDGLVVFAAGDGGKAEPSQMAKLPSLAGAPASLADHWITVAAVETARPNRLAAYSNGCGAAMNYCLVAPGDMTLVGKDDTAGNPTYWTMSSTQVAAPLVLGATTLVWGAFPNLSGEQVRDILLGTTTDLGVPGTDPIFGQGLINIEKALRGPGRLDWGDMNVFLLYDTDTIWWNDISGRAGINVTGSGGWLLLHGNNTFEGPLHIKGRADVTVNGSLAADIEIERDGLLYASEVTLEGDVTNRGSLLFNTSATPQSPTVMKGDVINEGFMANWGNTDATTMEGNLTLRASSLYQIELGAPPLHVNGHADIDGKLQVVGVAPGYVARSNTEVLIADGGIDGTFSELKLMGLMVQATLGYDANRVWLDVTQIPATTAVGMAFTPASFSAAERLDGAFGKLDEREARKSGNSADRDRDDVAAFANGAGTLQRIADQGALQESLDSLSGELHGADLPFATMAIEDNRHALESRIDALREGPAGIWTDELRSRREMGRFDMDAQGWTMGMDLRHDNRLTVGAALSEVNGTAYHAQRGDREVNRQYDGQLYATWALGSGYLLGTTSFGQMQRWTRREVLLGANAFRVGTDYTQRYATAGLQAGMPLAWNSGSVTLYGGAQGMQFERNGFDESGAAGFGLTTQDSTLHAAQAHLGTRLQQEGSIGPVTWRLHGRLEWQRMLSTSGEELQARFSAVDAWAPVDVEGLAREAGVFGLGFDARFGRRGVLGLNVDSRREHGEIWSGAMATWSVAY